MVVNTSACKLAPNLFAEVAVMEWMLDCVTYFEFSNLTIVHCIMVYGCQVAGLNGP